MSEEKAERLSLSLADLAPLVDPYRERLQRPWHAPEIDRDVVTNGLAMLAWDGHDFAVHDGGELGSPPPVTGFFEPRPELGKTTVASLARWSGLYGAECDQCGVGRALPQRCDSCGEEIVARDLGRFYGVVIDRALLARYLRPVSWGNGDVTVYGTGEQCDPVRLDHEQWSIVLMPVAPTFADGLGGLEPFPTPQDGEG